MFVLSHNSIYLFFKSRCVGKLGCVQNWNIERVILKCFRICSVNSH